MQVVRIGLAFFLMAGTALVARADSVLFGVPVTGVGGSQSIPNCSEGMEGLTCYTPATGVIPFFIPLKSSTSGIFGHTVVTGGTSGTFSDTGYGTANALTMFLLFSPVQVPSDTATLVLNFVDLDLIGVNDPWLFFEKVQFFSGSGDELTLLITTIGQSDSGSPLAFSVTGNSTAQQIFFPDVTSIMENPFYVQLVFGSQWNQRGRNTIESLTATLSTTSVPIPLTSTPEPGTLLLISTGLLGIGRRMLRSRRS